MTRQKATAAQNDTTTTQTPDHNGSNAGRARQDTKDGQEGTDGGTYKVRPLFILFY